MRSIRRHVALACLAGLTVSAAPMAAASSGVTDISATSGGVAAAQAAADRFDRYGVPTEPRALRVVILADGSMMIRPSTYMADKLAALGSGGAITVQSGASVVTPGQTVAAAPYWGLQASQCFSRTYVYGGDPSQYLGWMDACYHMHKVINDGDGSWDYFSIHAFATVDAVNSAAYTDDATVHVYRNSGPTFYWFDWSPRGDISGNCGIQSFGVSYGGVGLSYGHTVCEWWRLTKGAAGGNLKVMWDGWTQGAREVALMSAIKVANGGWPVWTISWGTTMRCITSPCPYQ